MKKFILKSVIFIVVLFCIYLGLFFLPTTPQARTSFLFTEPVKDSLLVHVESPRIIFIGGSNLSFGLNSQLVKDSLDINPVNTAVGVGLGLKYVFDHTLQYVKKGDIIVLSPEYHHFFRDYDYGSKEMLGIVLDVNRANIRLLNWKQIINSVRAGGDFIFSKFNPAAYSNVNAADDIYGISAYNQYGDACAHWSMERRKVTPFKMIDPETYNPKVVEGIQQYAQILRDKGAVLLIAYPGCQDISFYRSQEAIEKVQEELEKSGVPVLGVPERYVMPDSLLFEAPYHLTKQGVDYRTELLIEDIKNRLRN